METEHKAYWRCSVRVSRIALAVCKRLAAREGWELADLARTLICLGAAFSFLGLNQAEFEARYRKRILLRRMMSELGSFLGEPVRRPYASSNLGGSEVVTLRLPQGLSEIIATYARMSRCSVNHVLAALMQGGLIIYSKSENKLLQTNRSLTELTEASGKVGERNDLHDQSSE